MTVIFDDQDPTRVESSPRPGDVLVFDEPVAPSITERQVTSVLVFDGASTVEVVEEVADVLVLDDQAHTQVVDALTGEDLVLVTSDGLPGPSGPQGLQGPLGPEGDQGPAVLSGMYDWKDPTVLRVASLDFGPEIGLIFGAEIPEPGEQGLLEIDQIDKHGLNCGYFQVEPGQRLLVRCQADYGLHDLLVIGRQIQDNGRIGIAYEVVASDNTVVMDDSVEVSLFSSIPGEPVVGPPGPQGPAGPAGASVSYVHNQIPLSDTWPVEHNLNKYPSVTVVDTGDTEIIPNLHYDGPDKVTLTFGAPTSGKAYLN